MAVQTSKVLSVAPVDDINHAEEINFSDVFCCHLPELNVKSNCELIYHSLRKHGFFFASCRKALSRNFCCSR